MLLRLTFADDVSSEPSLNSTSLPHEKSATTQANRMERRTKCFKLLLDLAVAVHEAIDATGGIDERALTRVEGVRGVRDFNLYHRVGFAFKFHGVVGLCGRFRQEHIAV